MALKFKEGDKVRVKAGSNWGEMEGYTGVIVLAQELPIFPYNVTMDNLPEAVALNCPREGWMMEEDELEPINA